MDKPALRSLYDEIGAEKIEEIVNAFYPKVYADPVLIPIFTGDVGEIMMKQKMFLTQFTGGPTLYSNRYGHPRMRARHLPHEITPKRADRWLACMKEAFEEVGLANTLAGDAFYERLTQVAAIMVNSDDEQVF